MLLLKAHTYDFICDGCRSWNLCQNYLDDFRMVEVELSGTRILLDVDFRDLVTVRKLGAG